jgi:MFS family permease
MPENRLRNLSAAIAAITVFGFALGLMFPLLSLLMEQQGVSPNLIGLNTAMQPAGILVAGLVVPRIIRRFGARRTVLAGAYVAALIILSYPFFPIFWWWFILRFAHGFAVSILFTVSEAWIVQFSEGAYRSRILALYASVMALSFGAGPAMLSRTGTDGVLPFAIGAVVLVIATLPIYLLREQNLHEEDSTAALSTISFAPKAPVLLLAIAAFGIIDAANLSFLPVWGVKKDMTPELASLALTAFIVGNTVLQLPIGWLADHVPKRRVMIGCGLATTISSALLPTFFGTPVMWLLLIIAGASSAGIYTVGLAELGDRFKGQDLIAGSASFGTMWGLGAFVGALIAGWSMDSFGPDGLPYTLAIVFAILLLALTYRELKGRS